MKLKLSTVLLLCFVHFFLSCSARLRQPSAPQTLAIWYPPTTGIIGDFLRMDLTPPKLIWDANAEPDLSHYRVFFRTPGQNYNLFNEVEQPEYSLNGFAGECYFVVQAVDQAGQVSGFSNEVFYSTVLAETREIQTWPNTRRIKLLPIYAKEDTLGNPLTPEVRIEWRQMANPLDPSTGYDSGWRILTTAMNDYSTNGDTLSLNSPYLSQFSGEFTLTQDFRIYLVGPNGQSPYASPPILFKFIKTQTAGIPKNIQEIKVF